MSTFTGYKCDKCGDEHRMDRGQYEVQPVFLSVRAFLNTTTMPSYGYGTPSNYGVDQVWCRKCAMDHRIVAPMAEDEKRAIVPAPTAADMILNGLRELGLVTHDDLPDNS